MKKTCIFIISIQLIFFSFCNNKEKKSEYELYSNSIYKGDSLFALAQDLSEDEQNDIIYKTFIQTKIIEDKIVVCILPDDPFKHYFIKEFTSSGVNRFYCKIYRNYYRCETEYDKDTTFSEKDYKILGNNHFNYRNLDFEKELSDEFWNIPNLRLIECNPIDFTNAIKTLEDLVNNLEVFENFDLDSKYHKKILNELLILTQIAQDYWDINHVECEFVDFKFVYSRIIHINSKDEINELKKLLIIENSENKWKKDNKNFIKNLLPQIENEYRSKNIFYYYTKPDLKLFKFTVDIIDDKIILEKEYINWQYKWEDPIFFYIKRFRF